MRKRRPPARQPIGRYWPQAGIVLSLALNMAGLILDKPGLIGTGANILTVSSLFLVQRRRRANGGDE